MIYFDPLYFLILAPAMLLAVWAQFRVKATYHAAQQMPANLSGAAAARHVLNSAGLDHVGVEQTEGFLSDHYDPRAKVLRLSPDVYNSRTMAAVGIAAHEAGHAIQDAKRYAPLVIRNAAVPVASFGSPVGMILLVIGLAISTASPLGSALILAGIGLFSCVVFFQLINLPVEFDASARAKAELVNLGIVPQQEMGHVNSVLNAAAWTYVAATLQSVLTLLYFLIRSGLLGGRRD